MYIACERAAKQLMEGLGVRSSGALRKDDRVSKGSQSPSGELLTEERPRSKVLVRI